MTRAKYVKISNILKEDNISFLNGSQISIKNLHEALYNNKKFEVKNVDDITYKQFRGRLTYSLRYAKENNLMVPIEITDTEAGWWDKRQWTYNDTGIPSEFLEIIADSETPRSHVKAVQQQIISFQNGRLDELRELSKFLKNADKTMDKVIKLIDEEKIIIPDKLGVNPAEVKKIAPYSCSLVRMSDDEQEELWLLDNVETYIDSYEKEIVETILFYNLKDLPDEKWKDVEKLKL